MINTSEVTITITNEFNKYVVVTLNFLYELDTEEEQKPKVEVEPLAETEELSPDQGDSTESSEIDDELSDELLNEPKIDPYLEFEGVLNLDKFWEQ
jgi:hypothetical protein